MIQDYTKSIRNTLKWIEMVKQQAIDQNIDLKIAIRNNAEYMVNQQNNSN